MSRRAFTLEQANALLPHVRATLQRIESGREEARSRADKIAVLDALWGEALLDADNPDHGELIAHRKGLVKIRRAIDRLIREDLVGSGLRLPAASPELTLVDFPSTLDGRWVYLCWHMAEPTVAYWHEIATGFAGRMPITAEVEARLGLEGDPALEDDSVLDF